MTYKSIVKCTYKSNKKWTYGKGDEEKSEHLETVFIEELELSVRAYNCLKRANVHTLSDLIQYSADDLLEFKNFGQKSADEVCENLKARFDLDLKK